MGPIPEATAGPNREKEVSYLIDQPCSESAACWIEITLQARVRGRSQQLELPIHRLEVRSSLAVPRNTSGITNSLRQATHSSEHAPTPENTPRLASKE